MSDNKILTIAIPTFNRCDRLALLLESIAIQFSEVSDRVRVIVVDNDSADGTEECCLKYQEKISGLGYIRNQENIGAVRNVIRCFEMAETKYCWIIGDDDILRTGILCQLVALLEDETPDLVHLSSLGFDSEPCQENVRFEGDIKPMQLCALDFCHLVNVYTTFISGMIVNKTRYFSGNVAEERAMISDTLFPQLNWVFRNISLSGKLIYILQPLILARAGASGGYNLYYSFSVDLVRMIDGGLPVPLGNAIKRRVVLSYLPGLIVSVRNNTIGQFRIKPEDRRHFRECYSEYPAYWLLVEPILRLPFSLAMMVYKVSGRMAGFVRKADLRQARMRGGVNT